MRAYLVPIFMVLCHSSFAASLDQMTVEEAMKKGLLISAVRPDYPYEARKERLAGSGIFELKFDYDSGQVREIDIVKSTGHEMLDRRALIALRLWKAKPHSLHAIRMPITFTLKHR